MENIDIQQIESYLLGKMSPEERGVFEAALATNPQLRYRTEELRQLSEGIRYVAKSDLRKRVEAMRKQVKEEEAANGRSSWDNLLLALFAGLLHGIGLGWMIFDRPEIQQQKKSILETDGIVPVAVPQYEPIATIWIPSPLAGKYLSLSIMYKPDLDRPGAEKRTYALDKGGVGLCVYARREDDLRKKELALIQSGQNFYLVVDGDKFLLLDDGEEHPFPKEPAKA